jgi:tRNA nucleotidyltransferase/poly(A) polymerase
MAERNTAMCRCCVRVQVRFGTAEEDAYRRDFTFNALFYNVNTSQVEDLTGHGVRDLALGIVK